MKSPARNGGILLLAAAVLQWATGCTTPHADGPTVFVTKVKPVLEYYCIECHTDLSSSKFGGLSLASGRSAITTGRTGPVIVPGDPERSLLNKVLSLGHDNPLAMPPAPDKISSEQLADIRNWIRDGAPWPQGPEGHLALPQ